MTPAAMGMVAAACAVSFVLAWWLRDRMSSRRESRNALQLLDTLSSGGTVACFAWHPRDGVVLWNDGAQEMFRIAREDILGRGLPHVLQAPAEPQPAGMQARRTLVATLDNGETITFSLAMASLDNGILVAVARDTLAFRSEHEWAQAAIEQRNALLREVHHRIKNSLQGVANLLRQHLSDKPLLRPLLDTASSQVHAIATVHGLQGEAAGDVRLRMLVARVAASVSGIMHVPIVLSGQCAALEDLVVREDESVAVAMVLNELIMNAAKHRGTGTKAITVEARTSGRETLIRVSNPGFLPPNFNFGAGTGIGNGLGLLKSLLPRRGARTDLREEDGDVVASLVLMEPEILVPAMPAAEAT